MKVFKVAINYIITTKALKIMNKFISWFHDDSKKKISKICFHTKLLDFQSLLFYIMVSLHGRNNIRWYQETGHQIYIMI